MQLTTYVYDCVCVGVFVRKTVHVLVSAHSYTSLRSQEVNLGCCFSGSTTLVFIF